MEKVEYKSGKYISTHAPAQGATWLCLQSKTLSRVFQPTLPHRERLDTQMVVGTDLHFNPRSRTGSDGHLAGV